MPPTTTEPATFDSPDGAPRLRAGRFDDVSSSEFAVGDVFHPHSISVTRGADRFLGLLNALEFGPFVMGELDYNVGLALDCPHLYGYHLNMPVRGALISTTRRDEIYTVPGRAALYRNATPASVRTVSDFRFHMFALKIDARALENTASALLGRAPDREPVRFATELDLSRGDGLRWWNLLSSIRHQWEDNRLLNNPVVAAPLFQSILAGLLLAAEHQHTEALHAEPARAVPATVRLAEDFIEEHLAEPITVVDLAQRVGLSTRALQRGFLTHLGVTPTQYIRTQRLERAHAELIAGDPAHTRVADVALRWGFTHLGRFAHAYQEMFGVHPSRTLRA